MKVTITRDEYIPSGFKCVGCRRLKKETVTINGHIKYYCEITGYWLEQDSNGICYKSDDCLLAVKKQMLRR